MSSFEKPRPRNTVWIFEIDAVAFEPAEVLLKLAVAAQHPGVVVLRDRVVGETVLERRDFRPHVEERLERLARLLGERAAFVMETVLREIPDRQAAWFDDETAVGLVQTREHLQERGLAGAVWPAEAHALAIVDLPADGVEQHAFAERLAEGRELNHGWRDIERGKRFTLAQHIFVMPNRPSCPLERPHVHVISDATVARCIGVGRDAPYDRPTPHEIVLVLRHHGLAAYDGFLHGSR